MALVKCRTRAARVDGDDGDVDVSFAVEQEHDVEPRAPISDGCLHVAVELDLRPTDYRRTDEQRTVHQRHRACRKQHGTIGVNAARVAGVATPQYLTCRVVLC